MIEDLVWTNALDIGVEEMNDEHKQLIDRMNNIYRQNRLLRSKEEIKLAFDSLINYVEKHFKDEEVFMAQINYAGLAEHKELHQGLVKKLHKYRDEYFHSPTTQIPSSVFDFFKLWIVSHILIVDKKYGEFCQKLEQGE